MWEREQVEAVKQAKLAGATGNSPPQHREGPGGLAEDSPPSTADPLCLPWPAPAPAPAPAPGLHSHRRKWEVGGAAGGGCAVPATPRAAPRSCRLQLAPPRPAQLLLRLPLFPRGSPLFLRTHSLRWSTARLEHSLAAAEREGLGSHRRGGGKEPPPRCSWTGDCEPRRESGSAEPPGSPLQVLLPDQPPPPWAGTLRVAVSWEEPRKPLSPLAFFLSPPFWFFLVGGDFPFPESTEEQPESPAPLTLVSSEFHCLTGGGGDSRGGIGRQGGHRLLSSVKCPTQRRRWL